MAKICSFLSLDLAFPSVWTGNSFNLDLSQMVCGYKWCVATNGMWLQMACGYSSPTTCSAAKVVHVHILQSETLAVNSPLHIGSLQPLGWTAQVLNKHSWWLMLQVVSLPTFFRQPHGSQQYHVLEYITSTQGGKDVSYNQHSASLISSDLYWQNCGLNFLSSAKADRAGDLLWSLKALRTVNPLSTSL